MTERADKLRIMDRLKGAGLWEEAEEYREATRQRLREEGKTKEEAVAAAWGQMAAKHLPLAEQAPAAAGRTVASIPPPLAPIDLDENYCEKDPFRATVESVVWAAFEYRRVIVLSGNVYKVDYSRASRKPPTAMAMYLVEYYAAHPEKLDRLFDCLFRLVFRKSAVKPTLAEEPAVKTPDDLEADKWLRILEEEESSQSREKPDTLA